MFPGGGGGGGGANPYFAQNPQLSFHATIDGAFMGAGEAAPAPSDTHCHTLLYNLTVLREKVQQLQPLVGLAVGQGGHGPVAGPSASAIIQDIISAASSMMYAFQHLSASSSVSIHSGAAPQEAAVHHHGVGHHAKNGAPDDGVQQQQEVMVDHGMLQWQQHQHQHGGYGGYKAEPASSSHTAMGEAAAADTIIELDAAELLAKYTHYCQVCGKGFKRDANLRMHMRAHGDEYKSKAALASPAKQQAPGDDAPPDAAGPDGGGGRKYSCPQEGCRWNRKHAKFTPLKSVICVKNHYKRSHCPKMYICNRCNRKHFSVLSDLRTHEKHCGDQRWLCSCGTTFSRKDKLAGHVSLFTGHEPVPVPLGGGKHGKRSADLGDASGFSVT